MLKKTIVISEPGDIEQKHFKKYKTWPQYATWLCMFEGENWTFTADEAKFKVLMAANAVLEKISLENEQLKALNKAIELYGEMKYEEGYEDCNENWAEQEAGESW